MRSLRGATIACLVLGIGLLIPFENRGTLALGVFFLLSFVALGTYTLTGPGSAMPGDDGDGPG